jgi:hypothetical protein
MPVLIGIPFSSGHGSGLGRGTEDVGSYEKSILKFDLNTKSACTRGGLGGEWRRIIPYFIRRVGIEAGDIFSGSRLDAGRGRLGHLKVAATYEEESWWPI